MRAWPVGQGASLAHASANSGPAASWIAPHTPPPGASASFAAFTSASDSPGHEGPPQLGEFSWHELATTDHRAALDFYSKLFGWNETQSVDMGEMGTYQMYGQGEEMFGGMFNKPDEMPGPPAWLYYTLVDDIDEAVAKVRENGGQVLNGPMEVPGGSMIAQCLDPQGAMFALHAKANS